MNAKNQVSRKSYNDKQGKVHTGYAAKAARKRDGNIDHWERYAGQYGSHQRPGSMKKSR